MTNLEALKLETTKEMSSFMKNKENSYDMHIQEAAYWNYRDCLALVQIAESEEVVALAKSIFNRFKWYV